MGQKSGKVASKGVFRLQVLIFSFLGVFWVFFGCFLGGFWVVRREVFSVIFQEVFERLFLVVFGLFLSSFVVF